jgi:Domain of unknown function (DUF1735)
MTNNHFKKISGMKKNIINKFFIPGILFLSVAMIGTSCVKSVSGRTDFENLGPTVDIPEGGISNFSIDAILFPPTDDVDTATFHVNYAATSTAPVDEVITIAIDDQALTDYNAQGGAQYEKFPDSIYSFTVTTVTVPKGANYSANIPLVMFPSKIDLLNNYMLPISITVAPAGSTISSNFKTIYWHLIGNPIAGIYNWDWTRWNNSTPTGPTSGGGTGLSAVLAPVDGTNVEVPSGYFTQPRYEIVFDNNGGVLTNFTVTFNDDDLAYMKANGVTIGSGPFITTADPITGVYQFWYTAVTSSGPRYVTDKYYK